MAKLIPIEVGTKTDLVLFGVCAFKIVRVAHIGYCEIFGLKIAKWVGPVKQVCGVTFHAS